MKYFLLFFFILSSSLLLAQKKNKPSKAKKTEVKKGLAITGLPLVSFDDDRGLTYGARVIATYYQKDYEPYRYQIWAQYLTSSLGYTDHAAYFDYATSGGLRFLTRSGVRRDPLADYYGYGNHQDIRRIRRVTGDQRPVIPVGSNLARTDIKQNQIEDSQDRYYNYDYRSPYIVSSVESWFGQSDFKWFFGFLGNRYFIDSYYGDKDPSDVETNILTYLDIEQPLGYETIRDEVGRSSNYMRLAFAYDSRPRKRENNPNTGIFTDVHYENATTILGSDYTYSNITLTWRQYVNLFPSFWDKINMESVFAYRLMARETFGGDAPFFEAGKVRNIRETADGLGGVGGVRGFPSNQFIDKIITIANFELQHTVYKSEILGSIDFQIFGFYDMGRVAASKQEWQTKDFHKAYGPGVRAVWQTNTVVTLFFGHSEFHSFTAFSLQRTF